MATFTDTEKLKYRLRSLEILSSNNPSCFYSHREWQMTMFPPDHHVYPFACEPDFSHAYDEKLHPAMMKVLKDRSLVEGPNSFKEIHLVRMWFSTRENTEPTLLIIFPPSASISEELAKDIVLAIVEADTTSLLASHNPPIHIEICKIYPQSQDSDIMNRIETGFGLVGDHQDMYFHATPRPGSSLGLQGRENGSTTLCGYLRHDTEIFGLTSGQFGLSSISANSPYRHVEGEPKYVVLSPSDADHEASIGLLKSSLTSWERTARKEPKWQSHVQLLQGHILMAQSLERVLGHVVATSGAVRAVGEQSRLDWALILCEKRSNRVYQNKHCDWSISGILIPSSHHQQYFEDSVRNSEYLEKEYGIDQQWLRDASTHFEGGPFFGTASDKPLQQSKLYVKPPSARSPFQTSICSGTRSTLNELPFGITRDWAFLSPLRSHLVSKHCDHGSSILDDEYNVAALVWGGSSCDYPSDHILTFATPISQVLRDIEQKMGWEPGSCVWLEKGDVA